MPLSLKNPNVRVTEKEMLRHIDEIADLFVHPVMVTVLVRSPLENQNVLITSDDYSSILLAVNHAAGVDNQAPIVRMKKEEFN